MISKLGIFGTIAVASIIGIGALSYTDKQNTANAVDVAPTVAQQAVVETKDAIVEVTPVAEPPVVEAAPEPVVVAPAPAPVLSTQEYAEMYLDLSLTQAQE